MQRLKITAKVSKAILNDEMYFDGILYHAQIKRLNSDYWNFAQRALDIPANGKLPLPLKKQEDEPIYSFDNNGERVEHTQKNSNVYLCSKAYFEKKGEYTENIRKRFEELDWENRGGEKKKVYLSMGKYKNYDIPRNVILTDEIYWIVVGDAEGIRDILNDVHAIGKECNIGYGRVEGRKIEETDEAGQRVFPTMHIAPHEHLLHRGCFPPYANKRKWLKCAMRYF